MAWLTTGEAAELVGVHQSSIKRWCDEGRLACSYTDGGHRRIALEDLLKLAHDETLDCRLLPFGSEAEKVYRAVDDGRGIDGSYTDLVRLVYGWLQDNVQHGPSQLFRFMNEYGFSVAEICDGLLAPVLRRMGEDWRSGAIGIGDEHRMFFLITEGFHRLRSRVLDQVDERNEGPLAVVGCGDGNQHAMGAWMARLCLEVHGVRTVYLGPRLPPEEIALQQQKLGALLVCISLPSPNVSSDIDRTLRLLSSFYQEDQPYRLLLGGQAVTDVNSIPSEQYPFAEIALLSSIDALDRWLTDSLHTIS